MKNLRSLSAAVVLTLVLGFSTLADGQASCAPPGSVETPPCTSAQQLPDDSVTPADVSVQPQTNEGTDYSIIDAALNVIESVLSIL